MLLLQNCRFPLFSYGVSCLPFVCPGIDLDDQ